MSRYATRRQPAAFTLKYSGTYGREVHLAFATAEEFEAEYAENFRYVRSYTAPQGYRLPNCLSQRLA